MYVSICQECLEKEYGITMKQSYFKYQRVCAVCGRKVWCVVINDEEL